MIQLPQLAADALLPAKNLSQAAALDGRPGSERNPDLLKDTFQQFIGETFFQMMLKSMRKTHGQPAYLHGGRTEEIFQGQLDQELAANLARNAGESFSNELFQLFRLQLESPPVQPKLPIGPTESRASIDDPVGELMFG